MVYLLHTSKLERIKDYRHLDWTVLALSDFSDDDRKRFDDRKKISIAKDIQEIAAEVRANFIDYVGQLSNLQVNKVVWYSSRLASKSVSQTDIFRQYVYLKLLERLASRKNDVLIITDNTTLMEYVSQLAPKDVTIVAGCHRRQRAFGAGTLKVFKYVALWLWLRRYRKQLDSVDCLLHLWIDDRVFQGRPDKEDAYWGDLERRLKDKGLRVARLAPLSIAFARAGKIVRHVPNIIFPLAQLDLDVLWRSLFVPFDIVIDDGRLKDIQDVDMLTFLTRKEILKERASRNYLAYLLHYYAYRAVGAYLPDSASVIYPYENQPWEKTLNLALPGARRIGYQHSTIPVNWLDYYGSKYEVAEPIPDIVLTSGKRWSDFLRASNPRLEVREVGTIRYDYLFELEVEPALGQKTRDILIALPIDPMAALQLQNQILRVLESEKWKDYLFVIKPHPYLASRYIKHRMLTKFDNVEITDRPIKDVLTETVLCISVDSTVAFESVFAGVKTINFIPEDLTLGIEYFIEDCSSRATEENFTAVMEEMLATLEPPRADVGEFFSPINYELFYECTREIKDGLRMGTT